MITTDALTASSGICHGFFTRLGGVSEGPYESLNCGLGSDDDPTRVQANRMRAMERFGLSGNDLVTAFQVHSNRVAIVDRQWAPDQRPRVDGLATRTRGIALGILTADCVPVLFADGAAEVIGAAHAGWRGARAGVLEVTVEAMIGLGARANNIVAGIGPCIRQESYEVGPEFPAQFTADTPEAQRLFRPSNRDNHYLFDLPGYVKLRLDALSLEVFEEIAVDTFADEERFFSYRRTTLNGGGDYGRGLSAIALKP